MNIQSRLAATRKLVSARTKARHEIVKACNDNKYYGSTKAYYMRHLQQCVGMARRRQLVTRDVIELAGFNGSTMPEVKKNGVKKAKL